MDGELAALQLLTAAERLHHLAEIDHLRRAAGNLERRGRRLLDLNLDLGRVQMAVEETLLEAFARRGARILADQCVEQTPHRRLFGLVLDGDTTPFLFEADGFLDEVAGDLFDVAADIADLGELGCLDLHERCVGELRQTAADLGLAAAGRSDHQDVLGRDLVAEVFAELLAAPAVAHRDRDRAFRGGLADDVGVERGDDGFRGELVVHLYTFSPPAREGSGEGVAAAKGVGGVYFSPSPSPSRKREGNYVVLSIVSTVSRSLV